MPEISRFFGIIITMYFNDHPPPHFHARYGEHRIIIEIENGTVTDGQFPRRALQLVEDWWLLHRDELMEDWNLLMERQSPNKIEPLE